MAEELKRRLSDLRAAASVEEMPVAPQKVDGWCVFELRGGYKLVASPNHVKTPMKSGRTDWRKVIRLKVISIERSDD